MPDATADLFCKDLGHEAFIRAIFKRCCKERGLSLGLTVRNSGGGAGRAIGQFRAWQRTVALGGSGADLLILAMDANHHGYAQRRKEMESAVRGSVFPFVVLACPDPYVEAWYLADPPAFTDAFGLRPPTLGKGQDRQRWKDAIREVLEDAGDFLADVGDLAPELVAGMDLYRAGKTNRSLGLFLDELGKTLERLAG
jgi:hypothetical protein